MSAERPCLIALGLLVWSILIFFGPLGGTCQLNNPIEFNPFISE